MDWNELKGSLTSISEAEQAAMKHVGTLVMRRKELGYSQRTLAEMVEMPQSSIARIEALEVIPTLTTVSRLCEALGLTMELKPSVVELPESCLKDTFKQSLKNNSAVVLYEALQDIKFRIGDGVLSNDDDDAYVEEQRLKGIAIMEELKERAGGKRRETT